jgi:hypothetical protein
MCIRANYRVFVGSSEQPRSVEASRRQIRTWLFGKPALEDFHKLRMRIR